MALYPYRPIPSEMKVDLLDWPAVDVQFDSVYRQVRTLTNRPLRRVSLTYEGLTQAEMDVLRGFFLQQKMMATRFEYRYHLNALHDGGFETDRNPHSDSFASLSVNGGFESGDTGWIKESTWAIASDAPNARTGSWRAAKVGGDAGASIRNSPRIKLVVGHRYHFNAWVKSTAGATGTARVRLMFFDINGNELFAEVGNSVSPTTTYTESAMSGNLGAEVPDGAVEADVGVEVIGHTAGTWYADDVGLWWVANSLWEKSAVGIADTTWIPAAARTGALGGRVLGSAGNQRELVSRQKIPLFTDDKIYMEAWIKVSTTTGDNGGVLMRLFDAADAQVQEIVLIDSSTAFTTSWTNQTNGRVPVGPITVGSVYGRLVCFTRSGATTGVIHDFDDLVVKPQFFARLARQEFSREFQPTSKRWSGVVELEEAP